MSRITPQTREALGCVSILIVLFIVGSLTMFKLERMYWEPFEDANYETSFDGEIVDLKRSRGWVFFELDDGSKYNVGPVFNNSYSPSSLLFAN